MNNMNNMSKSKFRLLLLLLTVINLQFSSSNEEKQSLVVVLDVTTSMADKIEILLSQTKMLLDNVHSSRGYYFENYILVQFGDEYTIPLIAEPFLDTNYTNVKNMLNTVKILKGNDTCTASCYKGLKQGLELANANSIFLVFTDAGSNHKELLPKIYELTNQKRITYYFTLTKGCSGNTAVDDYRSLVSIYNGEVYNVDRLSIEKHFELLTQILTGPPKRSNVEIIVDSTISEFTLTVTGQNAIITIFDPNHKYVPSTRYKMLTNVPSIKMIQVLDPIPGRYTIGIVSETSYTAQVMTKTDLKFDYGFAINKPSSMSQTNYAPMIGNNTYLAISPSNASLVTKLEQVVLTTINGKYYSYILSKATPETDLYLTDSFLSPNESFKIHVYGRDRLNHLIVRLISTSITSDTASIPSTDVSRRINVDEGDSINLICRVKSLINVSIGWSKQNLTSPLLVKEFSQSDVLNYTIDSSLISDSGEYVCTAANSMGKTISKTIVTVRQIPLFVRTSLKSIQTEVDTPKLVIECNVTKSKSVKVYWLFNGKPGLPHGSQYNNSDLILTNIDRTFEGNYTCVGQKGAEQQRDLTRLNVMYPPNILNLVNTNTNTLIDITEPLKISNISATRIDCVHQSYPVPTVEWIGPTGVVISNISELNLVNPIRSGEYTCQVENQMGKAKQKIKIIVTAAEFEAINTTPTVPQKVSFGPIITVKHVAKPVVMQNYNNTAVLIEGNSFSMACPIERGEYNISWRLNEENIDNFKISDGSLYIDLVNSTMEGLLSCVGSNTAGSANAKFTIVMLRSPYDLVIEKPTGSIPVLNKRFEITCQSKARPTPVIFWTKDAIYFKHGNSILFDKFKSTDFGTYTCIAVNRLGMVNQTFTLKDGDMDTYYTPYPETGLNYTIIINTPSPNNSTLASQLIFIIGTSIITIFIIVILCVFYRFIYKNN